MAAQWYCLIGLKQYGPFSGEQIQQLVQQGQLQREHGVRTETDSEWTAAGDLPGLFPSLQAAPASPTVPTVTTKPKKKQIAPAVSVPPYPQPAAPAPHAMPSATPLMPPAAAVPVAAAAPVAMPAQVAPVAATPVARTPAAAIPVAAAPVAPRGCPPGPGRPCTSTAGVRRSANPSQSRRASRTAGGSVTDDGHGGGRFAEDVAGRGRNRKCWSAVWGRRCCC